MAKYGSKVGQITFEDYCQPKIEEKMDILFLSRRRIFDDRQKIEPTVNIGLFFSKLTLVLRNMSLKSVCALFEK